MTDLLADRLLRWFDRHGRTDLPWQQDRTPYRVWISEIMLQQTQVATVIPYFERFMQTFPDLATLAAASNDAVLQHWSGLGYYSRARNLHAAAQIVIDACNGALPDAMETLIALPGIGRSTAGAILALAHDQRQPILDGNVKRVLARVHAVAGWPGKSAVARQLWEIADQHTPALRVADYTQAIMDLGATVCTRSKPGCERCPLAIDCRARQQGRMDQFPGRKPRRPQPVRAVMFMILRDRHGRIMLQQRPPTGIWGGLWSFPECPAQSSPKNWCREQLGMTPRGMRELATRRHTFTHFHLDITPIILDVDYTPASVSDRADSRWWSPDSEPLGLPAPVTQLLGEVAALSDDANLVDPTQTSADYA